MQTAAASCMPRCYESGLHEGEGGRRRGWLASSSLMTRPASKSTRKMLPGIRRPLLAMSQLGMSTTPTSLPMICKGAGLLRCLHNQPCLRQAHGHTPGAESQPRPCQASNCSHFSSEPWLAQHPGQALTHMDSFQPSHTLWCACLVSAAAHHAAGLGEVVAAGAQAVAVQGGADEAAVRE